MRIHRLELRSYSGFRIQGLGYKGFCMEYIQGLCPAIEGSGFRALWDRPLARVTRFRDNSTAVGGMNGF